MFTGRKLALSLAFTILVALAFGVSCRGFFVAPTITSIAVGPVTPTIATGTTGNTVQMFAVATFNDGSTSSPPVSWSSASPNVASISASGLATAVSTGTSTITATANQNPAISGTQLVTVTVGCIQSIAISPVTQTLNAQQTFFQFTATATTCNGPVDITQVATWFSSNTSVATVSAGLVTATQTPGTFTVTISASSGAITSTTNATVTVSF
jgi:hypothetical protein